MGTKDNIVMKKTSSQIAKKIISENLYLSLATLKDSVPWNTALFYAADENNNFFCVSTKNTIHVKNIELNPDVAFTIFNSTEKPGDINGVQASAKAYLVEPKEIIHAATTIYKKRFAKTPSDIKKYLSPDLYIGSAALRLIKIVPSKIFILDPTNKGSDDRVEVKF